MRLSGFDRIKHPGDLLSWQFIHVIEVAWVQHRDLGLGVFVAKTPASREPSNSVAARFARVQGGPDDFGFQLILRGCTPAALAA